MDERFVKDYFKRPGTVSRWWNPEEEGSDAERRFHRDCMEYVASKIEDSCLIFDCGVGKGRLIPKLEGRHIECIGMDISFEMLRICRGKTNLKYVIVGDLEATPLKEGLFDYSVSIATFDHIPNPQNALSEISRITKKKGKAIVSFPEYSILRSAFNIVRTLIRIPFSSKARGKVKNLLKLLYSGMYSEIREYRLHKYYKKKHVRKLFKNTSLNIIESKKLSLTKFPDHLLIIAEKKI